MQATRLDVWVQAFAQDAAVKRPFRQRNITDELWQSAEPSSAAGQVSPTSAEFQLQRGVWAFLHSVRQVYAAQVPASQ